MDTKRRSMKQDEKAVSPVIGVIMMIAIVVIIAAVVAAFAYGIIGGVKKAPSTALVVEGVKAGEGVNVTIYHHGGDTIPAAFKKEGNSKFDKWDNFEVRLNGQTVNKTTPSVEKGIEGLEKNGVPSDQEWDSGSFAPGDQLEIEFSKLEEGDSIIMLHVPSQNIMQRISVSG